MPPLRYLAAAILMFLMLFTAVDVIGRYFFNKPVWGGFELTEVLLAVLIFAGLPLTTLRNGHIMVDLFDAVMPKAVMRIQHVITNLDGRGCTAFLAYRLFLRGNTLLDAGETTLQIGIKLAYVSYTMALLMAMTAVALRCSRCAEPKASRPKDRPHDRSTGRDRGVSGSRLRLPLAFAMGLVGFLGFAYKVNINAAAAMIGATTYETGLSYSLSVIPLFILMGNFVVRARMADELYTAANAFLGHRRGGLAMATIVASGGFGAICGSAIATDGHVHQDRLPADAAARLQGLSRGRHHRVRRHARHPDSAVASSR